MLPLRQEPLFAALIAALREEDLAPCGRLAALPDPRRGVAQPRDPEPALRPPDPIGAIWVQERRDTHLRSLEQRANLGVDRRALEQGAGDGARDDPADELTGVDMAGHEEPRRGRRAPHAQQPQRTPVEP